MSGHVGRRLLVVFALLASSRAAGAACLGSSDLSRSTVSIMRYFDDTDGADRPDLIGIQGTGWFLSPTTLVTVEHVTAAMKLSPQDWKPLEIVGQDGSQFVAARIQRLAGAQHDRLALIELQSAVAGARSVAIRQEPLAPGEQVMTFAYPGGRPRSVSGRFVRFGDSGKLAGLALLELYEGENRLIIDHGASGAPVVDCDGRVTAVVSYLFTQSFYWASREIRFSTAWGMPNIVSVPVQGLAELAENR
jgi:Trypsin-like peptidase domain